MVLQDRYGNDKAPIRIHREFQAMPSRFTVTCLRFGLVATGLIGCASATTHTYSSVSPGYGVTVGYDGGRATARFLYPGHHRPVFAAQPVPGVVRVDWIDPMLAQIVVPFGTGSAATWFETAAYGVGPLPGVMAVDESLKLVAYTRGHTIHIVALGQHLTSVSTIAVPSWCASMACRFHAAFDGDQFEIRARNHQLTISIKSAGT